MCNNQVIKCNNGRNCNVKMRYNTVKTGNNGLIEPECCFGPACCFSSMLLLSCSFSAVAAVPHWVWFQGIYCNSPPCGRHTKPPGRPPRLLFCSPPLLLVSSSSVRLLSCSSLLLLVCSIALGALSLLLLCSCFIRPRGKWREALLLVA